MDDDKNQYPVSIKRVTGYELIEMAGNNRDNGSYITWEIEDNQFFHIEKFILDIQTVDEFNAVMLGITVIYNELMFDSRYILSRELFGYMFEYYDISEIHNVTMKLYKPECFEFIEYPFTGFIDDLCTHYHTDPEKIKVLNKVKLLYGDYYS